MTQKQTPEQSSQSAALNYHEFPKPGKLEIRATKPMANGRDLSLAYSPGVAEASEAIAANPSDALRFTAKNNLVAVISNGTAVLGLGDIGALASKPVMEGKAVLFKKFANIDCFDIEVNETDPEKLAEIVAKLEPTFGAVNLEDIKAPECFEVERLCKERMNIPVFHDDQHGTAIVVGAATSNALRISGKKIEDLKIVSVGGGAAGIACLNMLITMGAKRENIWLLDRKGLVTKASSNVAGAEKASFAQDASPAGLSEVIEGADFFLGLSGPDVLTADMVSSMAENPIIFALANPKPEIMPEIARAASPGALIATGRSDFPNQVNNVLCFPFIFRGALDCAATEINDAMKVACVEAIAQIARETTSAEVGVAYRGEKLNFGPEYLIPKPFDPRLLPVVAHAVAKAAIESGVAMKKIDLDMYYQNLELQVYKSAMVMRPVFENAAQSGRRIVFAEGEDPRVLRTAQEMVDNGQATIPILVGRPHVVEARLEREGITIRPDRDFELVNPENDPRFKDYWTSYHQIMQRRGVTPNMARTIMRTNSTAIAGIMVHRQEADSMICGAIGEFRWHLRYVKEILSTDELHPVGAMSLIILDQGPLFVADTHINIEPSSEEIAETVKAAARHAKRFGIQPRIALCSGSQFGNLDSPSGRRMREALSILDKQDLDFQYEGEMHVDSALNPEVRNVLLPNNRLEGAANILVFANTDAAGATRNILKTVGEGTEVGPLLMGMGNRAHIVTGSITVRGLLNTAALAATEVKTYG